MNVYVTVNCDLEKITMIGKEVGISLISSNFTTKMFSTLGLEPKRLVKTFCKISKS